MPRFNVLLWLLVALSILMMVSANPRILAVVITCVSSVTCYGTDNDDTMNGSDQINKMIGKGGNDEMNANGGNDYGEGDNP